MLLHPEWDRACDDCEKWQYQDSPEQCQSMGIKLGSIAMRGGLPLPRVKGTSTPCNKCPKIPPSAPSPARRFAIEMTERSRKAWEFWLECRAVNHWPDDPIVRRCSAIIRPIYDEAEQRPLLGLLQLIAVRAKL